MRKTLTLATTLMIMVAVPAFAQSTNSNNTGANSGSMASPQKSNGDMSEGRAAAPDASASPGSAKSAPMGQTAPNGDPKPKATSGANGG